MKSATSKHSGVWRLILALWLALVPLSGQANEAENRIKAAFLYKFCGYIQWPQQMFEQADSPLVIGVVGNPSLAQDLARTVAGRHLDGRAFEVRQLQSGDTAQSVHVLYITREAMAGLEDFVSTDDRWPVLTVTDAESASPLSIINFVIVNQRVRFDIARGRADEVGLKLSSELLSVARQVHAGAMP